jgi:hypothetical protein
MDHYALSGQQNILLTWGAGPCVNIVVYGPGDKAGALSHVWNSSVSQKEIYNKAKHVVDFLGKKVNAFQSEIYLFGGRAFKTGSPFITRDPLKFDLAEYLEYEFGPGGVTIYDYTSTTFVGTKGDEGYYSGDIAFDPYNKSIYRLSDGELKKFQSVMTDAGAQRLPAFTS